MITQESEINRQQSQHIIEARTEDSDAIQGARRLGRFWLQTRAGWLARSIATFTGLVQVAVFRLRYHSGLSLLALVGIVLAVGLTASAGFFAQAVDQVMMDRELAEYTRVTGKLPFSARVFAASSPSVPLSIERAETLGEHVGDTLSSEVGLPISRQTMLADSGVMQLQPSPDDARYTTSASRSLGSVAIIYLQNVEEHISIDGDASPTEGASQGALDVWMSASLGAEIGAQVGDIYHLSANALAGDLPIRIAGFWQPLDPNDAYWPVDPEASLADKLLVRRGDYIQVVEPALQVKVRSATWQIILDEDAALPARARNYKEGYERAASVIAKYLPDARLTAPTGTLERFVGRQTALTTLLLGFNIPALGFLLYFLVLTSAVIAYWQRRETSLLRSRGISRISIFNFTLVEALLLFLVGCPLGLLFGILLARGMGYAASFLTFDWRPPLPVSPNGFNLALTAGTLGVVLMAKIWPVMSSARETVVTQAREHSRPTQGPFWYRNYLDLILLIPAFYGYQQLTQAGWLGALTRERPEDLYQDPLLVLVPGIFVVASALVMMRLFPFVMRLIDMAARHAPWLTVYLSFRQLGRQSHAYINPLLLVIVSLALGVYTLSMAASLDRWLADRIYYSAGADLAFLPYSETIAMSESAIGGGADWIPPIDEFRALPGVAAATRIGDYRAEIHLSSGSGSRITARFLGIDRVDFPGTAWWRRDFARESLGALMNRLALVPDGILVSQEFLTLHDLRVGDRISLLVIPDFGLSVRDSFTVVGVYEYFPTVYPDQVTVVGNLEYIFSYFGVNMPHNIWMRLQPDVSGAEVVENVPTTGIDAVGEQDAQAILIEEQAHMERVGVFGTLTVSFIAAALMAALGLLTYSYASLNERLYQFSVLRAVGLRRIEVVTQISLEYLILTAYGAAAGVLCGTLAAELFVPLFRAGTGENAPLPPLLPIIAQSEIIPLAAAFTGVMVLLEVFIISSAFFRRLFEALRLGHHG